MSDPEVLVEIVTEMGLDATRLAERIAEPAVKRGLRDLTEASAPGQTVSSACCESTT